MMFWHLCLQRGSEMPPPSALLNSQKHTLNLSRRSILAETVMTQINVE